MHTADSVFPAVAGGLRKRSERAGAQGKLASWEGSGSVRREGVQPAARRSLAQAASASPMAMALRHQPGGTYLPAAEP